MYKIRVERDFFLNLQQMIKVIKPFCWDQNFDTKALSTPVQGLYIHEKTLKNMHKIRVQRDFFKNCLKWSKWLGLSVDIKILPPGVCQPLPMAIYMWKNMKKCVEIVLKLATNGQSVKGFLLTSTFVPKGLSASALGLYTCIKALKYIRGPGIRRAFTGPLVLWYNFVPYIPCRATWYSHWRLAQCFAQKLVEID